jgi:hypothetical protein
MGWIEILLLAVIVIEAIIAVALVVRSFMEESDES